MRESISYVPSQIESSCVCITIKAVTLLPSPNSTKKAQYWQLSHLEARNYPSICQLNTSFVHQCSSRVLCCFQTYCEMFHWKFCLMFYSFSVVAVFYSDEKLPNHHNDQLVVELLRLALPFCSFGDCSCSNARKECRIGVPRNAGWSLEVSIAACWPQASCRWTAKAWPNRNASISASEVPESYSPKYSYSN